MIIMNSKEKLLGNYCPVEQRLITNRPGLKRKKRESHIFVDNEYETAAAAAEILRR